MADDTIDKIVEDALAGKDISSRYEELSDEQKREANQKYIQKRQEVDKKEQEEKLKKQTDDLQKELEKHFTQILEKQGFQKKELEQEVNRRTFQLTSKILSEEITFRARNVLIEQLIKKNVLKENATPEEQNNALIGKEKELLEIQKKLALIDVMQNKNSDFAAATRRGIFGQKPRFPQHKLRSETIGNDIHAIELSDLIKDRLQMEHAIESMQLANFKVLPKEVAKQKDLTKHYKDLAKKIEKIEKDTKKKANAKDSDLEKEVDVALNQYAFWHGEKVHDQEIGRGDPVALQYRQMQIFRKAMKDRLDDFKKKYELKNPNFHKVKDLDKKVQHLVGRLVGEALYQHFSLKGHDDLAKLYQKRFDKEFTEEQIQSGLNIIFSLHSENAGIRGQGPYTLFQLQKNLADELSGKEDDFYIPAAVDEKANKPKHVTYQSFIQQMQQFVIQPVTQYQLELEDRLQSWKHEKAASDRIKKYNLDKMPKPKTGSVGFKPINDTYDTHLNIHRLGRTYGFDSPQFYHQIKGDIDMKKEQQYEEAFLADTTANKT